MTPKPQSNKTTKRAPRSVSPAKHTPPASSTGGWKGPAVLAVVVALIAGSVTIYKMQGGSDDPASSGAPPTASAANSAVPPPVKVVNASATTGPEAGFAGADSCAECHANIAKSYDHIAMGQSVYRPTRDNIIEDYTTKNEFYHEPSRQYFRMTQEDGRFYQTRYQKGPGDSRINEVKAEVAYILGSGNHARSYLHEGADGKLYQLPVAWYPQEKQWAMNPGYDSPHHMGFSRRITYDCTFCHAAYPKLEAGADRFNYGESSTYPHGIEAIDCERCHGPGQRHVDLARAGKAAEELKASIVNTGNLSPELQMDACMQCHLETTSGKLPHAVHAAGRSIFSYRPGEPLADYRLAFDHAKGTGHDDKFEIAGQAYRLRMSKCFLESEGRMTCTTCHDPHRVPQDRVAAGIQSCQECHASVDDCTEKMEPRLAVADNCMTCHMPQRRTDDAVHVVMTDHYIQRRAPDAAWRLATRAENSSQYKGEIVPYHPNPIPTQKSDLHLGMAYVAEAVNVELGVELLTKAVAAQPDNYEAVYTRGVGLKMLGRLDEAGRDLERACTLMPGQAQARLALGDLYEQQGQHPKAAEQYRAAIKLAPDLSRAHNNLGGSLMIQNDLPAAEKCFHTAAACDPFDDKAFLNLAEVALRRGDGAAATSATARALSISPASALGWGLQAQAHALEGRTSAALWTAAEALRLDPANSTAFNTARQQTEAAQNPADWEAGIAESATREPFAAGVLQALHYARRSATRDSGAVISRISTLPTSSTAAMPLAIELALEAGVPQPVAQWGASIINSTIDRDEAVASAASALRFNGREAEAAELLRKEATAANAGLRTRNAFAWLLATAEAPEIRNAREAERLCQENIRAMGKPNIFTLSTLSAAQAEAGRYAEATATIEQALQLARAASHARSIPRLEEQLAACKAGTPYRSRW